MELFKLFGTLALLGVDEANKDIEETAKNAGGLGDKLKSGITTAAKWGTVVAGGAAAAAAGVLKVAMDSAAAADEIDKMSQKIGISKQGYQEWSYVLGQNGMDISSLQMGMKTLVTQMDGVVNGTESSIAMFDALGLSVYDSTGALKDQETMMNEALVALADMKNGTEKARLATELFGRSGSELMPMLNQGSSAMMDLKERAHDLGLVMSDETVTAGVVLGDTMDDVKKSLGMVATELGAQLMPLIQMALEWVIQNMPIIKQYVSQALETIGIAIEAIKPIVQALFQGIGVLWDTMLKPILSGIITFLTGVFTGDWKKAWEGLKSILTGIFNGIIGGIETMMNGAISALNGLISGINKAIGLAGNLLGLHVSIPTISKLNLPRLEEGGILEKGQVGLLEGNGAEAVVPLDRNSAWISAVAKDMENAVGGSGATKLLEQILEAVRSLDDGLSEKMKDAFAAMRMEFNRREVARMVKAVN